MIKREKKLQEQCLTYYNLLRAQDLWQTHCQILLITEGIHQIKGKHECDSKKCKTCEINYKDLGCVLNIQVLKIV